MRLSNFAFTLFFFRNPIRANLRRVVLLSFVAFRFLFRVRLSRQFRAAGRRSRPVWRDRPGSTVSRRKKEEMGGGRTRRGHRSCCHQRSKAFRRRFRDDNGLQETVRASVFTERLIPHRKQPVNNNRQLFVLILFLFIVL